MQRQVGDQRHPDTGGHQGLHHRVVVALVGDVGVEPGALAAEDGEAPARALAGTRIARSPRELLEPDRPPQRGEPVSGQRHVHLLVEQVGEDEVAVADDLVELEVVGEDEVGGAALQGR